MTTFAITETSRQCPTVTFHATSGRPERKRRRDLRPPVQSPVLNSEPPRISWQEHPSNTAQWRRVTFSTATNSHTLFIKEKNPDRREAEGAVKQPREGVLGRVCL